MFFRISDPYSFDTDPVRIRIRHFRLNTDPDPDPIRVQGFDDQKLKKINSWKKKFGSKTTIYLSLDLHKGRPSYRRSLQLSKENIQHSSTSKHDVLKFLCICGSYCSPGSGSGSGFRIRIRIRIHCPDWIWIQNGSGSETLIFKNILYTVTAWFLTGPYVRNCSVFGSEGSVSL